jgi:hypothetical protein
MKRTVTLCSRILAGALPLAAAAIVQEQTQTAPPLKIQVLAGENAVHTTVGKVRVEPAVLIHRGGKPVAGVEVTFKVNEAGPGGAFRIKDPSGRKRRSPVLSAVTGNDEVARGLGFRPNKKRGAYTILVRAAHGGESVMVELRQTNAWCVRSSAGFCTGRNGLETGFWAALEVAARLAVLGAIAASHADP